MCLLSPGASDKAYAAFYVGFLPVIYSQHNLKENYDITFSFIFSHKGEFGEYQI